MHRERCNVYDKRTQLRVASRLQAVSSSVGAAGSAEDATTSSRGIGYIRDPDTAYTNERTQRVDDALAVSARRYTLASVASLYSALDSKSADLNGNVK